MSHIYGDEDDTDATTSEPIDYYSEWKKAERRAEAAERKCDERDKDWILAIGHALGLGLESGFDVPITPEVAPFKRLFTAVAERKCAELAKDAKRYDALCDYKISAQLGFDFASGRTKKEISEAIDAAIDPPPSPSQEQQLGAPEKHRPDPG